MRHRTTAYLFTNGVGVVDDGRTVDVPGDGSLYHLVQALPPDVRRVFLVGPRPGGSADGLRSWMLDPFVADDWRDVGTHLDHAAPAIRLEHRGDGRKLEVYRAAAWFGEGDYSQATACATMAHLNALLKAAFGREAEALSTPGSTGRDLWARTGGTAAEVLDAETRELIATSGSSGQGRIEVCTLPALKRLPGLYCYDGILMYGALCKDREMPVGPVVRDTIPEIAPYTRARYRVGFRVPDGWSHVGLLPVWAASERRWHYPATPRSMWETWADGCEVELAKRWGWTIGIRERLLFDKRKVLDTWATRLIELRERVAASYRACELTLEQCQMLMAALRNMLLHTVGMFARREREAVRVYWPQDAHLIEASRLVGAPRRLPSGAWLATYREPLPASQERYQHPEWAAHIWAVARSRLLEYKPQNAGALTVPREQVLAFRTDAIYTSRAQGWLGVRPGQFRLKGAISSPVAAPHDEAALLRLAERLEADRG